MRTIAILSSLASAALASGAFAADLPSRKAPPPAYFEPAPAFSWSGFYAGVNAGGYFLDSSLTTAVTFSKETGAGVLAGATVGYTWQSRDSIVVGAEADRGDRGKTAISKPGATVASSNEGFLGTARARRGFAFDRALIYATGGAAIGNVPAPKTLTMPLYGYSGVRSGDNPATKLGWALGVGVEYAFNERWSAKGEYLYASLGKKTLVYLSPVTALTNGLVPSQNAMHILRLGLNYRFGGLGGGI